MDCRLSCELIAHAYAGNRRLRPAPARASTSPSARPSSRAGSPPAPALPPTRTLAADLAWGATPWCVVYDQLIVEGYLDSRVGFGQFVSDAAATAPQQNRGGWSARAARDCPKGCRIAADALSSRVQAGAFMPGFPDVTHFPFATWRKLVAKQMRLEQRHLAQYGYGGYGPLKLVLAEYLRVTCMMSCSPQQILILNGSHQALDLCAHARRRRRRGVDGGSGLLGGTQRAVRLRSRHPPGAGGRQGIHPQAEDWDHPPRLIFVSPSSQYPTGAVMSLERRLRLLEYAEKNRIWIIETTTTTRSATTTTRWPRCSACRRRNG